MSCEPECPNTAITMGESVYEIDPDRCTECVGHYEKPTCEAVCPINCIITDPNHKEDQAQLFDKFVTLQGLADS